MKIWGKVVDVRLRRTVEICDEQLWIYTSKKHDRYNIRQENGSGIVQGRPERVALCVYRPRESL